MAPPLFVSKLFIGYKKESVPFMAHVVPKALFKYNTCFLN